MSCCALVVLAGVAPRISVAGEALTDRTITFVRAIVDHDGATSTVDTDTMIVTEHGVPRVELDSFITRARQGRVAGGAVIERRNMLVHRISGAPAGGDSIAVGRVWMRPLRGASGAAAGGVSSAGQPRAQMILIKRRN